jgi:beta-lactamase regulating signal transducer with metallopeptidase domain
MNLAILLSSFILANALVVPAHLLLRCFRRFSAGTELRLHYFAISMILVLSAALPFLPSRAIYEPSIKVWSSSSAKVIEPKSAVVDFSVGHRSSHVSANLFSALGWFFGMFALGFSLARIFRELFALRVIRRQSFLIRKIRRVAILVNDQISVPFSYRGLANAYVVIPSSMLSKRGHFRIALAHELQHHRQGDTAWIYWLWLLRTLFALNPVFYFWHRRILEVQEFACDEALLDHGKVSSGDYARCLVETAETAFLHIHHSACATGLVFLVERHLISRRIEKMFTARKTQKSFGLAALALSSVLATAAFAAKGIVQDRRVSMKDAQTMLSVAQTNSTFPIVVNDLVLQELNRYIGTADGRETMRTALANLETYRRVVEPKLEQYGAPPELMAIPIVESKYVNRAEDGVHGHGAGLWMFIKSTACAYGLKVPGQCTYVKSSDQQDERLNVVAETDAAMRYLISNNLRFEDWQAAIFAYNVGEGAVQEGMETYNTRDVWKLIRNGIEGDQNYLARVMAAVLIMKNPDSVK